MDSDATGIANIYLRGYILGMNKAEIRRHIDDIAEFTGLGDFLSLPLRTYSAGMRARLAFAVSTVIRPDVLLIDEGIGAGDKDFFDKMQARLGTFVKEASILLLASHDAALVARFCNKRVTLQEGQIATVEDISPPATGKGPPELVEPPPKATLSAQGHDP
jgi:ABC-2 type transport system ATP-binding protein/lipopolysaccharide transport system ATP-binding protein